VHCKAGTERHRTVSFFEELKRRNVIRVAGLYIVGSWLIVQVATTILPMFESLTWLPRGRHPPRHRIGMAPEPRAAIKFDVKVPMT
jgi:hypothetical protein